MFRDVPECSGMFHVPGFIDAQFRKAGFQKSARCIYRPACFTTEVKEKPQLETKVQRWE